MKAREKVKGVTLIELLIAVTIISILAGISYPGYVAHLQNTRRADAQGALAGLAAAMERHFVVKNTYKGAAQTDKGVAADTGSPGIFPAGVPVDASDSSKQTYTLSISAASETEFTIQAIPKNAQSSDRCGTLTLNQAMVSGMVDAQTGLTVKDCWKR